MELSDAQRNIVEAPTDEALQVLASAGTGKTRVLTERVQYILGKTKKEGVIALTFTNKAAEEMRARLADVEQIEDRAWIATIHSVAQRILEKYGHTVGLPSELHIYERDKDRMEVFLQSLREDGINIDEYLNISESKELRNRERNLQSCMDIFSKIKRDLLTELEVAELYPNNNIWKIYKDYQAALLNSGGIDYDDILVYARQTLLNHDWIARIYRSKYKHLCVDEAQDLNKAQYEFIKVFCGDVIKSVLMVGDPNQMIYGFNGSSKDYFCSRFVEDFVPEKFELTKNYRSTKAVICAANKLRPGSQIEVDYALEGAVSIKEFASEEDEAAAIVATIKDLLEMKFHSEIEGEISPRNMVVLGRNRFVFSKLEKCLQDNSILYSIRKGERQLDPSTQFGKVLDYAIRVKLNSKDWVNGKKLCQVLNISEPINWESNVLNDLAAKISSSTNPYSEIFQKQLYAIDNLDVNSPNIPKLVECFKALLTSLVKKYNDASDNRIEDVKLSIEELVEFNNTWTRFKRKGLGDSLSAFRNALALGQLSDNALDDGLTLSTVHTMKGLEKDIVFLMCMCEGVFPDYRSNTPKKLDEERNNAFVAVTRAKRWLYISYPKQRMMPWGDNMFQTKSRFVMEIQS